MKKTFFSLLAGLAFAGTAAPALAAGFNFYEQGAKASGLAGAWVARADDAAANWYNPAALVWLEDDEFQFGTNLVPAGSDTDFTSSDRSFGLFSERTFEMESNLVTPSNVYLAYKLSPNVALGVGVNNPFGLVTEWTQRPVTFAAQKSELVTFYVNPNVAFRLNDSTSVAVGLSYVLADLEEFSREVPIDLDGNPLNGFEVIGGSNLTGDGDDLGWNVAFHHRGPRYSFGLTYRSAVTVELDGNVAFTNFGPLSPFFRDSSGRADLDLPALAAAGLGWESGDWGFEVSLGYAGWSDFDTLVVDIDRNVPGFVEDIALREDWDDTFSYRFGAAHHGGGPHVWRFGVVFDEGAAPPDTLRPSIPDADRLGGTVGYGYEGRRWGVDLYYMAITVDDVRAVGPEEGVITGEYGSFVQLGGISLRRRF